MLFLFIIEKKEDQQYTFVINTINEVIMKKIISLMLILLTVFGMTAVMSASAATGEGPTVTTSKLAGDGILVEWNKVSGATGYVVYRRAMKTGQTEWTTFARWNNTAELSFLDTKVYVGTKYQYGVKAYYGNDPMTTTELSAVGPMTNALVYSKSPAAPKTTTAVNTQDGIEIKWDAVPGAAGYVIYRRAWSNITDGWTAFVQWGTTNKLSYTDKNVYAGSKYQYGVKAYTSGSTRVLGPVGPLKTNVRITTRSLTVESVSEDRTVTVSWDPSLTVTGYQVQYAEDAAFTNPKTLLIAKNNTETRLYYDFTLPKDDTTYWTRVRSYKIIEGNTYYGGWSTAKSIEQSGPGGSMKLAIVYTSLGDFWDKCGQGGTKRVEELKNEYPDWKVELELTGASERGLTAQIQVVENLIALGYQGICIAPVDAAGMTPVINAAVDAGIFVVTMETDCPDSKRACFIGTHNENFGRKLAQFAVDWVDGGPKIILNHGAIAQLGMIQRLKGICDVVSENASKGAVLLDYQSTVDGGPDGQSLCEQMMLSNPTWNTTMCDSAGGSVVAAVWEENGWNDASTNHIHASVLSDDVNQVINAVKDGFATCTLVQKQWQWAYYGVDFMFKKIALGQDPGTDFYETSTFYVTLDNVYDDDMYPTRQ